MPEREALVEVRAGRAGRRRRWLHHGKAGNVETLLRMRAIIRESLGLDGHSEVKELSDIADEILRAWNVNGHNEWEIFHAVHEFISINVAYVQDRAGGYERIQYPLETLRRGYGDCDDLTILETTLLALCGIQILWLEAADYDLETDGYDHVYLFAVVGPELSLNGRFYLDPTAEDEPLGWHEPEMLSWVRVPVFEDTDNTLVSGFRGFWSALISIGGLVAAPFTGGLSIPASQVGAGIVGQKEAKGKQEKSIGADFDTGAGQVAQLFQSIAHQTVITVDDYNKAAAALSALSDYAAQADGIKFVHDKWNDPNYKPAFESILAQIKARALKDTPEGAALNTGSAGGNNATQDDAQNQTSAGASSDSQSAVLAIVGFGAILLVIGLLRPAGAR